MTTTQLLGSTTPRLWTPALRDLAEPGSTLGPECARFASVMLGVEFDPWQRWLADHLLELREDGSFRYRTFLLLVARQNGKTLFVRCLILWLLYTRRGLFVLGAAQSLALARETWLGAVGMVLADPEMSARLASRPRRSNGQECLELQNGSRYMISAATEDAGRGFSVDLLFMDELRTQRDTDAWGALTKTTMARPSPLTVAASNAGSAASVVLNSLRAAALAGSDPSVGLAEYSAPDGCALDDPEALAQANPSLGRGRLTLEALANARATDPPEVYRTECLCQHVEQLDQALDVAAWQAMADRSVRLADDPSSVRAAALDVSLDGAHVSLLIARPEGERVRVAVAQAWSGTDACRRDLPAALAALKNVPLAWYPSGPAAALAPLLRAHEGNVELSGGKVAEACMGLADLVRARRIVHPADPLLDSQVAGVHRLRRQDGFVFTRRGVGHADAAYALAGAVYVTLTAAPPPSRPRSAIF